MRGARRTFVRLTGVALAAATALVGMPGAAQAEVLECQGIVGPYYRVDAEAFAECVATWLDETGAPYVPQWVWDTGEYSYGFIGAPIPTWATLDKMQSDAENGPSCIGCKGTRAFVVKHSWAKELVGYRSGNYADELIDQMHVHAVLIHNASSSNCAGSAKYDGEQLYPQSRTAQYLYTLTLPDSPKKKGFNDRYTVAGGQQWLDDGGDWGLGAEFDICKQFH